MKILKAQATAARKRLVFYAKLASTGGPATGLTWAVTDVFISIDEGTKANIVNVPVEWDSTNFPGRHYITFDSTEIAAYGRLNIRIKHASIIEQNHVVDVVAIDEVDIVRQGMTALPNAAAEAAGGLLTRGTSTGQIQVDGAGNVKADVNKWLAGTIPAVNVTGVPIIDAKYHLGTVYATPATAGVPSVDVIKWQTGTIPAPNVTGVPLVDDKYLLGTIYATPATAGVQSVDAIKWQTGTIPAPNVAGVPLVDDKYLLGTIYVTPTTPGIQRVDVKAIETDVITATSIQANAITAAKIADAAIDYATFATDVTTALSVVRRNTATAGGGSTITLDGSASAVDSFYKNTRILIVSGTGVGQSRGYSSYVGSTKVYTVDSAWSTNPDNTSVFVLVGNVGGDTSALATLTNQTTLIEAAGIIRRNTATAGAASTITLDAAASATDDFYNNATIIILSGTGLLQFRNITDYVGSTKVATVDRAWTTTPGATSVFLILAAGGSIDTSAIATAVWDEIGEGSASYGDLVRLMVDGVYGKASDFRTDTVEIRSLDDSKLRATITVGEAGRLAVVLGDLT